MRQKGWTGLRASLRNLILARGGSVWRTSTIAEQALAENVFAELGMSANELVLQLLTREVDAVVKEMSKAPDETQGRLPYVESFGEDQVIQLGNGEKILAAYAVYDHVLAHWQEVERNRGRVNQAAARLHDDLFRKGVLEYMLHHRGVTLADACAALAALQKVS